MFGGQHRVDELRRAESAGWTDKAQLKKLGAPGPMDQCGCHARQRIKFLLTRADFVRDVRKIAYVIRYSRQRREPIQQRAYLRRDLPTRAISAYAHIAMSARPQAESSQGHVFLSHAGEDARAAEQLAETLRHNGLDVWFDKHDLQPGESWMTAVESAINGASGQKS
jgi:hypothetical protein